MILFIIKSITSFGQANDSLLFIGFKQGTVESDAKKAGNCASVAIIKAAIGTYGVNKVFSIHEQRDTVLVILKNGTKLALSKSELDLASKKSAFIPGDTTKLPVMELYRYAQLCFAVLCKNYQNNFTKNKTYEQSIDIINQGYTTAEIYKLLGLKVKEVGNNPSYETLKPYKNLVLWNSAHGVYFNEGYYDEAFVQGISIEKIENLRVHHCGVKGWLKNGCKPRNAYYIIID